MCTCLIVHGCLRSDVYQRNELSNAWVLACTRYRNVRFSHGNVVPFQTLVAACVSPVLGQTRAGNKNR